MHPYQEIFNGIYSTLKRDTKLPGKGEEFDKKLEEYKKLENRTFSDEEYFDKLVKVVFYSGFKARTVDAKMKRIDHYFSNYQKVSEYDENKIKEMMQDEEMIKNYKKIDACIENARTFKEIVKTYNSFQYYVDSFEMKDSLGHYSFENLILFKEEIEFKFKHFAAINAYHFMTEIGLPVLKLDIVVKRIFYRLGLIDTPNSDKQILKTVTQGRKMSEAVGCPIRAVDILLIKYGQMGEDDEFKLDNGICLEINPKCHICGVKEFCRYQQLNETRDESRSGM